MQKQFWLLTLACIGLVGIAPNLCAQDAPVEYVKVCTLYGAGFHYIPGTDVCVNDVTGDAREETAAGVWRTWLPYALGQWVTNPQQNCTSGKLSKVGDFKSTDFSLNAYGKSETKPVNLQVGSDDLITKVIMSGGFYDPRVPGARSGINGSSAFCIRSKDPNVFETQGNGSLLNPPYGDGMLPIGCISNSRILNMPAAYSIAAMAAYPNVDVFPLNAGATSISGPYVYGNQLVVTTDVFNFPLTYQDSNGSFQPLAGTLSAWVCVESGSGSQNQGGNGQ